MGTDNITKELSFENTPLQNLKNILQDADAVMVRSVSASRPDKGQDLSSQIGPGVSKTKIRQAINNILGESGPYVSAAFIGKIACQLLILNDETNSHKSAHINIYINRLNELIVRGQQNGV